MRTLILQITLLIIPLILLAKSPVGTWENHLSYQGGQLITFKNNEVYCLASNNLFYLDRTDFDDISSNNNYPPFYKLSKLEGLNDVKITYAKFSAANSTLVIAYNNGNIDLIKEGKIYNLPFLKNKTIGTDKSTNDITFKDNYAYLSCNFGIIVIDLEKIEIKDTYIIGEGGSYLAVNAIAFDNTHIYAATTSGLKKALASNNFLVSSEEWSTITEVPNSTLEYEHIAFFNNTLWAVLKSGNQSSIYTYSANSWKLLVTDYLFKNIDYNNSNYLITFRDKILIYSNDLSTTSTITQLNIDNENIFPQYNDAKWDKNNNLIWITSQKHSLIKYNILNQSLEILQPQGPYTDLISNAKFINDKLYVLPGGTLGSYDNLRNPAQIYVYDSYNWQNVIDLKNGRNQKMIDYTSLAISPIDPDQLYVSSWNYGVSEFTTYDDNYTLTNVYDQTNSPLYNIISKSQFVRTNGMAFDSKGNLWISNSESPNGIKVLKTDGTWQAFFHSKMANYQYLDEIKIDQNNVKWLRLGRNPNEGEKNVGLLALNENGTIDDKSDDEIKWVPLKDQSGEDLSTEISSFTFDLEGNLWAGLGTGIAVFYNPEAVFTNSIYASQILIPRNDGTNLADALLDGEKVTAIEVDGGNRKWLGTVSNGLLLVSEDGQETIRHFTEENSPLLSNTITTLSLDNTSGRLYIGTDQGMLSYQTDATKGEQTFSSIHAYPNPARLSSVNTIIVTGLISETLVKITDANGNLVYETLSNGGQAAWDATDLNGSRVSSGVYYIFCASADGSLNESTKVLVIN